MWGAIGLAAGSFPVPAFPSDASPAQFVGRLLSTVKQVKKADPDKNVLLTPADVRRNEELAADINRMLDIDQISTYALMDHWGRIPEPDRGLFVSTFTELLTKVAYPNAGHFLEDLDATIRKEKVLGQRAMIYISVVHTEEGRIDIDFKLQQSESGWKVIDVYLDGVSLARNLRTQCLKIIQDHSFQELISRMQKKIEEKDTAHLKEVTGKD